MLPSFHLSWPRPRKPAPAVPAAPEGHTPLTGNARWSFAARMALPLLLSGYALTGTHGRLEAAGLADDLMFTLLIFLLLDAVSGLRGFYRRMILSFTVVMGLSCFFLFMVLNFRFFHSWGQMDALKQWEDLFAIWSGVLTLMRFSDMGIAVFLPLLLWQVGLITRVTTPRAVKRPLVLSIVFLGLCQFHLAAGQNSYANQNPLFYVLRQKIIQWELSYGSLWELREGPRRWKNADLQARNTTLYAPPENPAYPFFKQPRPQIEPLPFALESQPNVVLILMESVRALESGSYGARPSFTPRIDRLAREGVLFKNFYANGAQTIRGEFAIHSSFIPNMRGGPVYYDHPGLNVTTLPMVLKRQGYSTLWIGAHPPTFDRKIEFLSRHGIDGFRYDVKSDAPLGLGAPDVDLFNHAFDVLARQKTPFFAEIMTLSNHYPFSAYPTDGAAPPVRGDPLYQRYCRGMFYTDFAVGAFLTKMRKSGLADNTVFILTGDHGVWVYPDGEGMKGMVARQEAYFRVPLVLWSPRLLKPAVIRRLGSHIDITPTVLDLLNLHPPHSFLGTSLFRDDVRPRFVLMEQDTRWNLRVDNDYAYDVGPEAFLSHFPVGRTVDYNVLLKKKRLEHLFFRTDRDLFHMGPVGDAVPLGPGRAEELATFAEEATRLYDRTLLNDHIDPPRRNPAAIPPQEKIP